MVVGFKMEVHQANDVDGPDVCFSGNVRGMDAMNKMLPTLYFQFSSGVDNVTVDIPMKAENYLFEHPENRRTFCLGLFMSKPGEGTLVGAITFRNFLV